MILADRYRYSEEFLDRCRRRLEFALAEAPAYREWRSRDPGAARTLDERYDALPALDKAAMRAAFPDGLVPASRDLHTGLDAGEIEYTFTSGSTSEKMVNIFDQAWWCRSERAAWKLNSVLARLNYPQPTAKLASSLNVGISCEEDLPMDHRILGGTLYLNEKISLLQWRPAHFERMVREINAFRPAIIEANPSLLARLALWADERGLKVWSPAAIVFTYEFSSKIALAAIRRVFSSPFVSSYGTTETGFVLEECEAGLLHQNTEFCRIDFQPLSSGCGLPEVGRIFVTTFDNPWNCVLRFDTGDLVRLHPAARCACGRADGMIVEAIEGRTANLTFTVDGCPVTTRMLDDRLSGIPAIRDYRLSQPAPRRYALQAILADRSESVLRSIRGELAALYGAAGDFTVTPVDDLIPGPAGKFRRTCADFDFDCEELFK